MEQIKIYMKAALKVFVSISPVLIALSILYEIILKLEGLWNWQGMTIYAIIISLVSTHHYSRIVTEIPMEGENDSISSLKKMLIQRPWKIINEDSEKLIVYPKFDRLYSWIHKERVIITAIGENMQLEGAKIYVEKIKAIVNDEESIWDKKTGRYLGKLILLLIICIPILMNSEIIGKVQGYFHEIKVSKIEKIEIKGNSTLGNSANNINNYGAVAESDDHVFYVKDNVSLVRADKDFNNETYLIKKSSGDGISHLNIMDEWIFYRSNKSIYRMKTDGSKDETIYDMGYAMEMHVLDNWIYFISHNDDSRIYKIDINGQNLQVLNDTSVRDISIYENRIYYSYEMDGEGYLESMDLDGNQRQPVAEALADLFVKDGDTIYYTNYTDFKLYKYDISGGSGPIVLVDDKISSFLIVDDGIYFSEKPQEAGYPGTGLFKIDINGNNKTKIVDDTNIENLSSVGDWILFSSSDGNEYPTMKRMNKESNTLFEIK